MEGVASAIDTQRVLQALDLKERIALYTQNPAIREALTQLNPAPESLERVKKYINDENPDRRAWLNTLLQEHGIDQTQFEYIATDEYLTLLTAQLHTVQFPRWYQQLLSLYTSPLPPKLYFSALHTKNVALAQFFDPFEPIIHWGRAQLRQTISAQTGEFESWLLDYAEIEKQLLSDVAFTLFEMIDRTLVLELNIAKVSEQLKGDTPEARFQDFIGQLMQEEQLIHLLEDYPILFRKIYDFIAQWVVNSAELVLRLNQDVQLIEETFGVQDATAVKKLHINAGDKHNGNKTVIIITYGDEQKVVYKPRPLGVDKHYQAYLSWYNALSPELPLKVMKLLDQQSYGYAEFISHETCTDTEALDRYYARIGVILCLLYIIKATDFHHENIIAHGEQPVLIDLESLFHSIAAKGYDPVDETTNRFIQNSVLNIQLLPFKLYYGGKAVDISGITSLEGAEAPAPVPTWQAQATDEMKITRMNTTMKGSKNTPIAPGEEQNLIGYTHLIKASFERTYQLVLQHKAALLDPKGVISAFGDDHIRLLLRPTSVYANYIRGGFHPDYLQNFLYRQKLWGYLWHKTGTLKVYRDVVPSEVGATEYRDVPFFSTKVASTDLYGEGELLVANYFDQSGLSAVQERINQLSEADCARQSWFIEASLATTLANNESVAWQQKSYLPAEAPAYSREALAALLRSMGDRIDELHMQIGPYAHWASLILSDESAYDIKSLMMDVYSGLPGVALFLGALHAETGGQSDASLLLGTLNNIRRLTDRYKSLNFKARMGAYDGWFGLAYSLHHVATMTQNDEVHDYANDLLDYALQSLDDIKGYDVLTGSAGVIMVLDAIAHQVDDDRVDSAIGRLADRLVEAAVPASPGLGWVNSAGSKPLAGFGHGAAGIMAALSIAFRRKPKQHYRETIEQALRFERSLYDADSGNWRDVREVVLEKKAGKQHADMVGWCHGAMGVGLGRLLLLQNLGADETMIAELRQAIDTVVAAGFGRNHSLCHGDMGNIDFLRQAATYLKDDALRQTVQHLEERIVQSLSAHGPVSGIANGVENPGLMTGSAGIGYGLLQIINPQRYPSLLTLATPLDA